ncbi:Pollen-specific leucine-rich repeat extensin-like protein 1 [Linum perenne]
MAASHSTLFTLLLLLPYFSNKATSNHAHHHHHHHTPSNPRLHNAYLALQAWKRVIYSDPFNYTSNWVGPSVCNYSGVFCTASLDDPGIQVVAGLDLNHGDIAGFLPDEMGLLTDLALIHLNSNRFCGILPQSFSNLSLLYELDLSNNRFVGLFPSVVLSLSSLKFLDLRYNEFEGPLPPQLFQIGLDAIFINNNRFTSSITGTLNTTRGGTSALVIANNRFSGCLPPTISNFAETLEELVLVNSSLTGCLPPEVGYLYKLKLLDVSNNKLVGPIPYSLAGLAHLEVVNLEHNLLTGIVPDGVCILPQLVNFTFGYNFFCEEEGVCMNLTSRGVRFDDRRNCLPDKPFQRSKELCNIVAEHPVDCFQRCDDVSGAGSDHVFDGALVPVVAPVAALTPSPT